MTKDNERSHQGTVNCTSVTEHKRLFYNLVITQLVKMLRTDPTNTVVVRNVNIVYDSSRQN